jgi:hypothetical protein
MDIVAAASAIRVSLTRSEVIGTLAGISLS